LGNRVIRERKMKKITIKKGHAKKFLCMYNGLSGKRFKSGKTGIMEYIKKAGCIQFDPLNMVGNNQDLVLQSRIKNYNIKMLRDLLYKDRKLVDYWDKNMSIFSVEDWPYFDRNRNRFRNSLVKDSKSIYKILPEIRKIISEKGSVSSLDLEFNEKVDWWWAPTKISRAALESMYFWGELIVHNKINTRKYYDFSHKHIDKKILNEKDPNEEDVNYYEWYVLRRISSIGILWNRAGDAWLGIHGLKSADRNKAFKSLREKNKIIEVEIENINFPFYINNESLELLEDVLSKQSATERVSFIAPLDNMIWDRKLIREIFDFEYVWEVYKPAKIRQYGYYILPILFGKDFVARFEPVRDKKTSSLIIKNWWWEEGLNRLLPKRFEKFKCEFSKSLKSFMNYLEVDNLIVENKLKTEKELKWLELQ